MNMVETVTLDPVLWAVKKAWRGKKLRWGYKPTCVLLLRRRTRSDEHVGSATAEHTFTGGSYHEVKYPLPMFQPEYGDVGDPFQPNEWGLAPNTYYNLWGLYASRGRRFHIMYDYVGLASREHWVWYKPVYHAACVLEGSSTMPNLVDTNGNTVNFGSAGSVPPHIWETLISRIPQAPALVVDDLSAGAEMRFREIANTQVDILALIIETLEMFVGDESILLKLQANLRKGFETARKGYRRVLARGGTKTSALWLAWRWGIAPLIKDIKALINLLDEAEKQLAWIKKVCGRPTDIQFRRKDVWNPGEIVVNIDAPFFQITADTESRHLTPPAPLRAVDGYVVEPYLRCRLEDWKLDFGATGRIQVNWDRSLTDDQSIRKLRRALMGLTRPWDTVWEVFHLSWFYDYLTTTRAKLERAKQLYAIIPTTLDPDDPDFDQGVNEIPLPTQIAQGHSWHLLSMWHIEFVNADNSVADLGSCLLRVYTRQYGLPKPDISGIGAFLKLPDYWGQYANLAAWQGGRVDVPLNWKLCGPVHTK